MVIKGDKRSDYEVAVPGRVIDQLPFQTTSLHYK